MLLAASASNATSSLEACGFGHGGKHKPPGNYAASVLKDMYGESLPRAAQKLLKDHAQTRSSSAPPPKSWSLSMTGGGLTEQTKQPRKRVDLKVPRVGRDGGKSTDASMVSLGAPPRPPMLPRRKTLAQIRDETSNFRRDEKPPPAACDGSAQKARLQDMNAFGFGSALPNTHAPPGMPAAPKGVVNSSAGSKPRRRVIFSSSLPPSRVGSPNAGACGLTEANESLASEIVLSVKERQRELGKVEDELSELVKRAEEPTPARRQLQKQMADADKRRREIQSSIRRDVQDLEKLVDLTPGD
eukprot:TRINITY_DN57125_c0_g1_i1.p1 TRINITY_DN57125_c0_g1~~TRINITY_DN57125_c0_g1_i1.p1  ORF type:complete len:300 (+),score=56.81 TRINITY_DN57125_c0_g1_i1:116-1015(+)